ncbi:MAG: hypothetical protein ACLQHT_17400 [Terracidiphilus sp.]
MLTKTARQLSALTLGAAWVIASILFSEDLFAFATFAFPGVATAALAYAWFSRRFRRSQLMILAVMAAWISMALFIGLNNCCITPAQARASRYSRPLLPEEHYRVRKTASDVRFEILQVSMPGVLLGFVGLWWVKRKDKEKSERLEWEIEHSPVSQPFPKVSTENFGSVAAPSFQYSFYCYCGMEIIDELPTSAQITVVCSNDCREYDLARKGKKLFIVACR